MRATFTTRYFKNSPSHAVINADGAELATSHCVNVKANLFTIVVDGRWAGVKPEADAIAYLKSMAAELSA
jgi:hypothetical protein